MDSARHDVADSAGSFPIWHTAGAVVAWDDREWHATYCGDNGLGSLAEPLTGKVGG